MDREALVYRNQDMSVHTGCPVNLHSYYIFSPPLTLPLLIYLTLTSMTSSSSISKSAGLSLP